MNRQIIFVIVGVVFALLLTGYLRGAQKTGAISFGRVGRVTILRSENPTMFRILFLFYSGIVIALLCKAGWNLLSMVK